MLTFQFFRPPSVRFVPVVPLCSFTIVSGFGGGVVEPAALSCEGAISRQAGMIMRSMIEQPSPKGLGGVRDIVAFQS